VLYYIRSVKLTSRISLLILLNYKLYICYTLEHIKYKKSALKGTIYYNI